MTSTEKLEKLRVERTGEVSINRHGTQMKLINYINSHNVTVEFQDNYNFKVKATYRDFLLGKVDNPYDRTLHGIGYLGVGQYDVSQQYKKIYSVWKMMFDRCYGNNPYHTKACYDGCIVDPAWFNFQNFAKWYENNYYEIEGQRMQIDKDILHKGNIIYSPDRCIIVPNEINALFVKRKRQRGDTPIGVYYNKNMNAYVAFCWTGGKLKEYLGRYNTPEEAFNAYKIRKEQYIKEVADKYKDKIPAQLYDALYAYEVEITD